MVSDPAPDARCGGLGIAPERERRTAPGSALGRPPGTPAPSQP